MTIASIMVIIGMWLERYLIIVPTLQFRPSCSHLGPLRAYMGRDLDHCGYVRDDGSAVSHLREVVP